MDFFQMIEHGEIKYYFAQKCVTVDYHGQYIAFNTYSSNKKKNFKRFSRALVNSESGQYSSINDMYGLARRYHLTAVPGKKPEIVGNIAF